MGQKKEESLAAVLIDGNDAVDRLEAVLARLDEAPEDGEALGQGIDACRCLCRRAAPLGQRRLVVLATAVARRLADARNGRRALDADELDGLAGSGDELRTILDRLESGRGGSESESREG